MNTKVRWAIALLMAATVVRVRTLTLLFRRDVMAHFTAAHAGDVESAVTLSRQ